MPAPALAVIAKKAAVVLLTDKRTWVVIGSIIAGFIILCVLPMMVLISMFGSVNDVDINSVMEKINDQQIIENMTQEQRDNMLYLKTVFTAIDDEITIRELDIDPIKAQIIYLSLLNGKEKENETFYTDYISCCAEAENDDQIFSNIAEKYGVIVTADEKDKIILLYNKVIGSLADSS